MPATYNRSASTAFDLILTKTLNYGTDAKSEKQIYKIIVQTEWLGKIIMFSQMKHEVIQFADRFC